MDSISIRTPQEFRDHVVYGPDFFDAHNHPEIRFVAEEVERQRRLPGSGTAHHRGGHQAGGGDRLPPARGCGPLRIAPHTAIDLTATVDRRDWGMDWQMPMPSGGDVLGCEVVINAHIELVKEE